MDTATTNCIAAAVKAALSAARAEGIDLMRVHWAAQKSGKRAISTDRKAEMWASPSGAWWLRHDDRGLIASGQV